MIFRHYLDFQNYSFRIADKQFVAKLETPLDGFRDHSVVSMNAL
jgi:hypothetical protein